MRSAGWGVALGCSLVWAAGCGTANKPVPAPSPAAGPQRLVLHVPDMTRRLDLA